MTSFKSIGTNPYQDWRIIFYLAVCAVIILLAVSVYIFSEVKKGEFYVSTPKQKSRVDSIDRKVLTDTIEAFSQKKLNFEDLRLHPRRFDDPAI